EAVAAWTLHETDGAVLSVAVVGEDVYLLVDRGGGHAIEMFDPALHLDCALTGTAESPAVTWSGLDHLEGRTVSVVADGIVRADQTVAGGAVTLEQGATAVQI